MCLVASISSHRIDSMQSKVKEDLNLERELKLINKAPVKSIHVFHALLICHNMILLLNLILLHGLIIFLLFNYGLHRQNRDTFLIALILKSNRPLTILYL